MKIFRSKAKNINTETTEILPIEEIIDTKTETENLEETLKKINKEQKKLKYFAHYAINMPDNKVGNNVVVINENVILNGKGQFSMDKLQVGLFSNSIYYNDSSYMGPIFAGAKLSKTTYQFNDLQYVLKLISGALQYKMENEKERYTDYEAQYMSKALACQFENENSKFVSMKNSNAYIYRDYNFRKVDNFSANNEYMLGIDNLCLVSTTPFSDGLVILFDCEIDIKDIIKDEICNNKDNDISEINDKLYKRLTRYLENNYAFSYVIIEKKEI